MKELRAEIQNGSLLLSALGRAAFLFFSVLALAAAAGRELTPIEMIREGLPAKATMKSASKAEFLAAICEAVRKHRSAAAAITAAGVETRRETAGDIVGTVLRCSVKVDCEMAGAIVSAAVAANGSAADVIADAAIAKVANCSETIQKVAHHATSGTASQAGQPSLGAAGAEAEFDPHEPLILVCDEGAPRTVRQSLLDDFLHAHPGSFAGQCPPTPTPTPPPTPNN